MRFFTSAVAFLAAVASAQVTGTGQSNAINIPPQGLQISAGSNTITWANPSSSTVTIKLVPYGGVTTPSDGFTVASGIQASAETATVNIPANEVVAGKSYVFEIIDDSNTVQPNYSNNFVVSGATGSATSSGSSSGTMTATSSGTVTITGTSSSSSGTNTATSTTHSTSSRTSSTSSAASTSPTGAPNSGATKMSAAQGGLFAFMAAVIAIL